jgi:hypothetical protein
MTLIQKFRQAVLMRRARRMAIPKPPTKLPRPPVRTPSGATVYCDLELIDQSPARVLLPLRRGLR